MKQWLNSIIDEELRNVDKHLITYECSVRKQLSDEELRIMNKYIWEHNLPKDWYFTCYYCETCYEHDNNKPYHVELINYQLED